MNDVELLLWGWFGKWWCFDRVKTKKTQDKWDGAKYNSFLGTPCRVQGSKINPSVIVDKRPVLLIIIITPWLLFIVYCFLILRSITPCGCSELPWVPCQTEIYTTILAKLQSGKISFGKFVKVLNDCIDAKLAYAACITTIPIPKRRFNSDIDRAIHCHWVAIRQRLHSW